MPAASGHSDASLPGLTARVQMCEAMAQHVSDLSAIQHSLSNTYPASDGSGGFEFSAYVNSAYFGYYPYDFENIMTTVANEADPTAAYIVTYDSGNISTFDNPMMQDAVTSYFTAIASLNTSSAAAFAAEGMDVATAVSNIYSANMATVRQMLQLPGSLIQVNNHHFTPLTALSYLQSCDSEYMGIHDWCTYLPGMTLQETQLINFISSVVNANIGIRAAAVEQLAFSVMMANCSADITALSPLRPLVGELSSLALTGVGMGRAPRLTQAPCQPRNYTCMYSYKVETGQISEIRAVDTCTDTIMKLTTSYSVALTACAVASAASFGNVASIWSFVKAGQPGATSYLLSAGYNWFNLILTTAGSNLPVGSLTDVATDVDDATQVAAAIKAMLTLTELTGSPFGALLGLPGLLCAVFGLGLDVYKQATARCEGYCSLTECALCAAACCSGTVVGDFASA